MEAQEVKDFLKFNYPNVKVPKVFEVIAAAEGNDILPAFSRN